MSLPRFHLAQPWTSEHLARLPEEVSHHALKVLRLRAGTSIEIFDGMGGSASGELLVSGKHAGIALASAPQQDPPRPPRLTLIQGIASGDKMDWIMEKATELGVDRIIPVAAQRSVLRLQGERRDKRWLHWQRVALAACAQCGRNRLPDIPAPCSLLEAMEQAGRGLILLCDPDAEDSLLPLLRSRQPTAITLLIGPEGGWAPEELQQAAQMGAQLVRYAGHILRTETAGLALAAASAAVLGWND